MATAFCATCLLTTAGVYLVPPTYAVTTHIMTNRSYVMPALVHPRRSVPLQADAPTRGAIELMTSRDNLEQIMADVDLVTMHEKYRSILGRIKDNAFCFFLGPPSPDDLHEGMLQHLARKLRVSVDNNVVMMTVSWKNPHIAYEIVADAVERFLSLRRDIESSELIETVNILERSAIAARKRIEAVVALLQETIAQKESAIRTGGATESVRSAPKGGRFVAVRQPTGRSPKHGGDSSAPMNVRRDLRSVQATIETIKRDWERRVLKAQEHLAELRETLGPDHPDVIAAVRDLDTESRSPADLANLQAEEERLSSQFKKMRRDPPADAFKMVRLSVSDDLAQVMDRDPEIQRIMAEMRKRQADYDEVMDRLANARIEIETATAAFDYRYVLTQPPVFPKKPVGPKKSLIIAGGVMGGLWLAILLAVAADVLSGRIMESWQVERFVGVRVFGESAEP